MNFFWSKKTRIFLSEGPNLDILWVFRDEIGSVRTRIVDLMTISVSKKIFYRAFDDFGLSETSSKKLVLKTYFVDLGGNRGLIGS